MRYRLIPCSDSICAYICVQKAMKIMFKRFFYLLLLTLLGGGGYVAYKYFSAGNVKNQFSFLPDDFVLLIESDKPLKNWQTLSQSKVWQVLKQSEYFADITQRANQLDSLLLQNRQIAEKVNIGKMLISVHTVGKSNYDFLINVDMNDQGKLEQFKSFLSPFFSGLGYRVTKEIVYNYDVFHLYDPKDHSTLTLSLVGNVLLASYTKALVKNAIQQSEKDNILDNENFKPVYGATLKDGPYTLTLNYRNMDAFIRIFSPDPSEMLLGMGESLAYTGINLQVGADKADLNGYSLAWDSATTYINAFKSSGTGKNTAGNVLPQSTALYTSIGFSDFNRFYQSLLKVYQQNSPKEYEEMVKSKKKLEDYLKAKVEDDIFSWMTEEAVAAVVAVEQPNGTVAYENYALLHFSDESKVREKLKHLERQIKRKSLFLKFDKEEHMGYEIRYLEMKGFFKLFFKKLFNKIEKPHYVILGNYVIFSNEVPALKYMIEQYAENKTLAQNREYQDFVSKLSSTSNLLMYFNQQDFFPYLRQSLSAESRSSMEKNKAAVMAFRHIALQVKAESSLLNNRLFADVREWKEPEVVKQADSSDQPSEPEMVQDSVR